MSSKRAAVASAASESLAPGCGVGCILNAGDLLCMLALFQAWILFRTNSGPVLGRRTQELKNEFNVRGSGLG
jgi:hypothetical protein